MKKMVFFLTVPFLMAFSCNEKELHDTSICDINCEDKSVVKTYSLNKGLVKEVKIGPNAEGKILDTVYVILDNEKNVLVPCKALTEELQMDSVEVIFSGNKMNCCNLITQPYYRTSYGCKLEITSIEKLQSVED